MKLLLLRNIKSGKYYQQEMLTLSMVFFQSVYNPWHALIVFYLIIGLKLRGYYLYKNIFAQEQLDY